MDKKAPEYTLDFVLPCGVTGPTGPTGPGNELDMCFVSFSEARAKGYMNIESSTILPDKSDAYTLSSNTITIQKNGIYEITFCGELEASGISGYTLIQLVDYQNGSTTVLPDMTGKLPASISSAHFSETSVFKVNMAPRNFMVQISFLGTGTIMATSVNVIIKRLSD